jgi:hypothetical protein
MLCSGSASFEMQGDHGVGVLSLPEVAKEGPGAAESETGHDTEHQQ